MILSNMCVTIAIVIRHCLLYEHFSLAHRQSQFLLEIANELALGIFEEEEEEEIVWNSYNGEVVVEENPARKREAENVGQEGALIDEERHREGRLTALSESTTTVAEIERKPEEQIRIIEHFEDDHLPETVPATTAPKAGSSDDVEGTKRERVVSFAGVEATGENLLSIDRVNRRSVGSVKGMVGRRRSSQGSQLQSHQPSEEVGTPPTVLRSSPIYSPSLRVLMKSHIGLAFDFDSESIGADAGQGEGGCGYGGECESSACANASAVGGMQRCRVASNDLIAIPRSLKRSLIASPSIRNGAIVRSSIADLSGFTPMLEGGGGSDDEGSIGGYEGVGMTSPSVVDASKDGDPLRRQPRLQQHPQRQRLRSESWTDLEALDAVGPIVQMASRVAERVRKVMNVDGAAIHLFDTLTQGGFGLCSPSVLAAQREPKR